MKTPSGKAFRGVSRYTSGVDLQLNLDRDRIINRQQLQEQLERKVGDSTGMIGLTDFARWQLICCSVQMSEKHIISRMKIRE